MSVLAIVIVEVEEDKKGKRKAADRDQKRTSKKNKKP